MGARRKRLSVGEWLLVVLAVGGISFIVDETTGDRTGPPYHDPIINQVAFVVLLATIPVLIILSVIALMKYARGKSAQL